MAITDSFIQIDGPTPAGVALAVVLEQAGVGARLVGSTAPGGNLAVCSRAMLVELGLADSVSGHELETVIDRVLSEDDATDAITGPSELFAVGRQQVVDSILTRLAPGALNPDLQPALKVDAGEYRLGDPDTQDDTILPLDAAIESVQVEWPTGVDGQSRWIRMTGETLAEVGARASFVATPDRAALTLTVPLASIVETSIAVPDILSRLLAHPSVRAEVPDTEPVATYTRILRIGDPVHLSLDAGTTLRIGAAAGLADPIRLDRELRSGMVAGAQIAAALAEGRLTLARLSRISRDHSLAEPALQP